MIIDKIILENYRIYQGINELPLSVNKGKNVTVISGNNGYGKTTLLTSLVWGLYGKLMVDVDDRYRREIYESGGYKRYCEKTLNRYVKADPSGEKQKLTESLSNASSTLKEEIKQKLESLDSFSVTIILSDIYIPSIPCKKVQVKRIHNVSRGDESIKILIDGQENELTRGVGPEIFINDFILAKEIAKFFFFDAEKIVSLAEIKTIEEKKQLSQAYSEVLGIKKYEDLKDNLENIRIRLRKQSGSDIDREKFKKIKNDKEQNEKLILYYQEKISILDNDLAQKKYSTEQYQAKLIREGSFISLDELKDYKLMVDQLGQEAHKIKSRLKEFVDLAPFAIASNKLKVIYSQVDKESQSNDQELSAPFIEKKLKSIKQELNKKKQKLKINAETEKAIYQIVSNHFQIEKKEKDDTLLDFSFEEKNSFKAIYNNLLNAYSHNFKKVVSELKINQSAYKIYQRKLQNAESKENDLVVQELRKEKVKIDNEIKVIESEIIDLKAKIISIRNELTSQSKVISELTKKIEVDEIDKTKDEIAVRLIKELDEFIKKLKNEKKIFLQEKIQLELNKLMHKSSFIKRVEVQIQGDSIDVELFDNRNEIINKDGLSKGEQQLYATALLKALVDESNIRFPIFIDSPLQKFDKKHAKNIIRDFYPSVSKQVVLFPLLEKELTENEYSWLLPKINKAFIIQNSNQDKSSFREVKPDHLFKEYKEEKVNVY